MMNGKPAADTPVRMLEVGWNQHVALLVAGGMAQADAEQQERAFYAGAYWLQILLQDIVLRRLPPEKHQQAVDALQLELEEAEPLITGDGDRPRIVIA